MASQAGSGGFASTSHYPSAPARERRSRCTPWLEAHTWTFGTLTELPNSGSALENPYVYDASARELKVMALQGLLRIVDENRSGDRDGLIRHVTFERLR